MTRLRASAGPLVAVVALAGILAHFTLKANLPLRTDFGPFRFAPAPRTALADRAA